MVPDMTVDFPVVEVREGKARFFIPDPKVFGEAGRLPPSRAPVFYNPRMSLNRDLAVLFLKAYQIKAGRTLKVCEPMAGCGVRGLRFALEVDGLERIVLNDLSRRAYELAKLNVKHNGLEGLISVENEDAHKLLCRYSSPRQRLDYVDLDPFGSPSPFLDSALRAVRSGGVLALTATDTAPLSGLHVKACMRKYLGKPLRVSYWREIAVRLLIGAALLSALRHDLAVNPLFSYGVDHYVRAYVEISRGAKEADKHLDYMGFILHCRNCLRREVKRGLTPFLPDRCGSCGSRLDYAGPLWLGRLVDKEFCEEMLRQVEGSTLENVKSTTKLIVRLIDEADAPLTYYVSDEVCERLKVPIPPINDIVSELNFRGYLSTRTHFHDRGFKTEASSETVLEVIKEIVEEKKV